MVRWKWKWNKSYTFIAGRSGKANRTIAIVIVGSSVAYSVVLARIRYARVAICNMFHELFWIQDLSWHTNADVLNWTTYSGAYDKPISYLQLLGFLFYRTGMMKICQFNGQHSGRLPVKAYIWAIRLVALNVEILSWNTDRECQA